MILFERTERGGVVAAGAEGSTLKRRTRGFDPSRDLAKQKPVVVPMKDHLLQKQTVQPQSAMTAQSARRAMLERSGAPTIMGRPAQKREGPVRQDGGKKRALRWIGLRDQKPGEPC